jgi:hypothetical protein
MNDGFGKIPNMALKTLKFVFGVKSIWILSLGCEWQYDGKIFIKSIIDLQTTG